MGRAILRDEGLFQGPHHMSNDVRKCPRPWLGRSEPSVPFIRHQPLDLLFRVFINRDEPHSYGPFAPRPHCRDALRDRSRRGSAMVFVKAHKTKAYFKRFQVKYKRRREPLSCHLQGALDGGLDVPHSDKRFAGFKKDEKQLDAEFHRNYIFGGHVASYMRTLMEDEPDKYQTHFSEYIKRNIGPDDMEELYKKVHAAIRADPATVKSTKEPPKEHKRYNLKKLTYEERKAKLIDRLNALNSATIADDSDEDDE
ncbi:hypothetical protein BHE74_00020841 [Ensete ventricosum]|nr:hypothetical protein BHE74_00020841 [Ensete ventricosum]RZR76623.1 hypothetical protein BHM03_00001465 [Ensete ventricosum]